MTTTYIFQSILCIQYIIYTSGTHANNLYPETVKYLMYDNHKILNLINIQHYTC